MAVGRHRTARTGAGGPPRPADAVGAFTVAGELAELRGAAQITRAEVEDAAITAYVKGDRSIEGRPLERITRAVLVGSRMGAVAAGAGRPPLLEDYYREAKAHRVDVSGAEKTVRCDVFKQPAHRRKSAFLHRCRLLEIPMFGALEGEEGPFKGPDLVNGERLDLTTETWAVAWTEEVDDRLVEVSDRGATLAEAARAVLDEQLVGAGLDVAAVARCVLAAAQARATGAMPRALERLLEAAAAGRRPRQLGGSSAGRGHACRATGMRGRP